MRIKVELTAQPADVEGRCVTEPEPPDASYGAHCCPDISSSLRLKSLTV